MIQVEGLNLAYNDLVILKDFSLRIETGEKVVIHGESGSGKSSFFKILLGFEQANSGLIEIDGIALNKNTITDLRAHISWVPQEVSIPVTTLADAAKQLYSLKANQSNRPSDDEVLTLLDRLGVTLTSLNRNLNELSGGERQRFFITLALLLRKPILLLDEPTSALDAANSRRLGDVLKSFDTSLIAISHDPIFTESFDRKVQFFKQNL